MNKPVTRIIISIAFSLIICELAYLFVARHVKRYESHMSQKLTEIFENKTPYDVLFVGSSKTHTDINPQIIDSICHTNSYNAGVDGISLFEFKMIFDGYLINHPPPKLLVISFDLHSFYGDKKFFKYDQYFPFINNQTIDTALNNNGHSAFRIKWIPLLNITDYTDDQKIIYYLKNLKGINEIQKGNFSYKGYASNTDETIKSEEMGNSTPQKFSKNGLVFLKSIIKRCLQNKTQILLVYSPEYKDEIVKETTNANEIFDTVNQIAMENNIKFIRNDTLSMCSSSLMFRNVGHLNRSGAQVYSKILASQINQKIEVNKN